MVADDAVFREDARMDFEGEGLLEGLEGEAFEPAQYEALASLAAAIAQRYPIAHIAGHEHIAPGRKGDPGAQFDWALLRRSLPWPRDTFPD